MNRWNWNNFRNRSLIIFLQSCISQTSFTFIIATYFKFDSLSVLSVLWLQNPVEVFSPVLFGRTRIETAFRQPNLTQFPKRPFAGMDAYNIICKDCLISCYSKNNWFIFYIYVLSLNSESDIWFSKNAILMMTFYFLYQHFTTLISTGCKFP